MIHRLRPAFLFIAFPALLAAGPGHETPKAQDPNTAARGKLEELRTAAPDRRRDLVDEIVALHPDDSLQPAIDRLLKDPDFNVRFAAAKINVSLSPSPKSSGKGTADPRTGAVPFRISSVGSAFAVQCVVSGTYRVLPDSIEISIDDSDIRLKGGSTYRGRYRVNSVSIGLGQNLAKGGWDTGAVAQAFAPKADMTPGDVLHTGSASVSVPIIPGTDLSTAWILVKIESLTIDSPPPGPSTGWCYAHDTKRLAVPPTLSENR